MTKHHPVGTRIHIGNHSADRANYSRAVGQTATIIDVDKTDDNLPYEVYTDTGMEVWIHSTDAQLIQGETNEEFAFVLRGDESKDWGD